MQIPKYYEFQKPMLEFLADGEEHLSKDMKPFMAEYFNLDEEALQQRLPSGAQTIVSNRIGWARTYLKRAGLIIAPSKKKLADY